jgi:predicted porin
MGRTLTPAQRIASNYDPHGTDGIGSLGSGGILIGHSPLPRFEDGIYYETPNWSGFTVFAGFQADDQVNATDERFHSVRLRFQSGPIDVSLGNAELSPGNRVNSVGAAYDFKFVKPMLQYHSGERAGRKRTTTLVGLTAPLGAGELRAAWTKADDKSPTNIDRTLAAVGYDYSLSRRTLLYGTVVRDKTTGQTSGTNGFEVGIRHSF